MKIFHSEKNPSRSMNKYVDRQCDSKKGKNHWLETLYFKSLVLQRR